MSPHRPAPGSIAPLTVAGADRMVARMWLRSLPFRIVPLLCALGAPACGSDLGECDSALAKTVVYSAQGLPHYAGQALNQETCAGGSFCHSAAATGSARIGVPHGLDFDVPVVDGELDAAAQQVLAEHLQKGLNTTRDWLDEMNAQVQKGAMPPGEAGMRPRLVWHPADGMGGADTSNKQALPDIREDEGKEVVRNWLACGAPVVASTPGAPSELEMLGDSLTKANNVGGPDATWDSIYELVIGPGCGATCHTANVMDIFPSSDLDLSADADGGNSQAHANMLDVPAFSGGPCAGMGTLIVPGDCEGSLLIAKLRGSQDCGDSMPLAASLLPAETVSIVCEWIDAGAEP